MRFRWDSYKAVSNIRKHGITFEEASTVLADPLSITISDPLHPGGTESRYVTVGQSEEHRILVVVHAEAGNVVRLISARQATPKERKRYEARP